MKRFTLVLAALVGLSLALAAPAFATGDHHNHEKVWICHGLPHAASHDYNLIHVSVNAVDGEGQNDHTHHVDREDRWDDIIPAPTNQEGPYCPTNTPPSTTTTSPSTTLPPTTSTTTSTTTSVPDSTTTTVATPTTLAPSTTVAPARTSSTVVLPTPDGPTPSQPELAATGIGIAQFLILAFVGMFMGGVLIYAERIRRGRA